MLGEKCAVKFADEIIVLSEGVQNYFKETYFYVNKLGFSVIRENYRPERKDWKLDLRVNEHTELEIFAEENPPKRVNRPEACGLRHLAFCVESVEQTVNELAEVGIECEPIRVTYIYGMFYRFGLIDVPDEVKEKMGHPKDRKRNDLQYYRNGPCEWPECLLLCKAFAGRPAGD